MNKHLNIPNKIKNAIRNQNVVALESTVISHGLPYPDNIKVAQKLEKIILDADAVPATVGIINGELIVGLNKSQLEILAKGQNSIKVTQKNYGIAISRKLNGGTTVAGTIIAAHQAGIQVFATGGIGGVHRGNSFDESADLFTLSKYPMIVVCAGAKSILDLPATIERLETYGIAIIGYKTDQFPAFFSLSSGLPVDYNAQSSEEIIDIALHQWGMNISSSILVVVPPPPDKAVPNEEISHLIEQAVMEAEKMNIHGSAVTPYLLARLKDLSKGKTLDANLALLENNALVAAEIANSLAAIQQN